jgi:hypothetical protein
MCCLSSHTTPAPATSPHTLALRRRAERGLADAPLLSRSRAGRAAHVPAPAETPMLDPASAFMPCAYSQPLIRAPAPSPSLAMMVRLACPGAWPRVVGAPLPPSSGITIALATVLGKPLAVHRLPHGRPAHDPAGEGFGAFATLVAWLAPLLRALTLTCCAPYTCWCRRRGACGYGNG